MFAGVVVQPLPVKLNAGGIWITIAPNIPHGPSPINLMRTPLLLDVPKSAPSAHERLQVFKAKHGILTHYAPHMRGFDDTWLALIPFEEDKGRDVGDAMAHNCRLYDEAGRCATAKGELSAVRLLCQQLNIPCDL